MTADPFRADLLREQFAPPVREYTGLTTGPTWHQLVNERWDELAALGDDVWVLHTEYVRLRVAGTPVEDIDEHVVQAEQAFRAAEQQNLARGQARRQAGAA